MKKIISTIVTTTLALGALGALSLASIAPASAGESPNIGICHATGSDKYVAEAPSKTSIVKGTGHGDHADDIIPTFSYKDDTNGPWIMYPGKNLDKVDYIGNSCVKPLKTVTPIGPKFVEANCMNQTGTITAAVQPQGVTLVMGPKLNTNGLPGSGITGVWMTVYTPADGYKFPDGVDGIFRNSITAPTSSDPNWDAEAGQCKLPDTGVHGISSSALLFGGIFVGLGLMAVAFSTIRNRRKA